MSKNRPAFLKPLLWAYSAVGAFTALSVIVPIIWDRMANRPQNDSKKSR